MKNIWLITKTNIKRNLFAVILSVVGAAMLCLILYSMGDMMADMSVVKVSIGLIDNDKSDLSNDFKGYLIKQLDYDILENFSI